CLSHNGYEDRSNLDAQLSPGSAKLVHRARRRDTRKVGDRTRKPCERCRPNRPDFLQAVRQRIDTLSDLLRYSRECLPVVRGFLDCVLAPGLQRSKVGFGLIQTLRYHLDNSLSDSPLGHTLSSSRNGETPVSLSLRVSVSYARLRS